MTDLVVRAQLVLLARTLHVPVERVAHLERLGAQRLHELQDRMSGTLFDQHNPIFERISSLVPIIPLRISIPIVQRLVPPVMTGRAAGAVGVQHPKKAADAVGLLDVAYAADCAPYLDPRTVGQLADVAPPEPVVRIVNELLSRRDYITAGPFLAYATADLVRAVEAGVADDEGLIRSASYAFSAEAVSAVVRQLLDTGNRIPTMLATVVNGSKELRLAALSVFARCDDDVIAAVGELLLEHIPPSGIADLLTTVVGAGGTPDVLRFVGQLSAPSLLKLALNPGIGDVAETLVAECDGSTEIALWRGMLELLARSPGEVRRRAGRQLAALEPATLHMLPTFAQAARLWPPLLWVLAGSDVDAQAMVAERWARAPRLNIDVLDRRIQDQRLESLLATLTTTLRVYR
ncbi:hypothetical protein HLB23_04425 [Nocardia uniformis]|uniref:Uncharacterized protein n=1 Tax=Nocardia uniformis TaxID=53432 RepID=A0A849BR77_9NOCA|nr:hypothetical protein [Nocardia uniformis]NNH69123.1 hypothetical protein [Nocardia uniformis]